MSSSFVKLVIFVPITHSDQVRDVLANAGAGKLGAYDSCSFSSRGIGRFRPLKGATPMIGKEGILAEVEEERIEVLCPRSILPDVLQEVRKVHPYEEPAFDAYPLEKIGVSTEPAS